MLSDGSAPHIGNWIEISRQNWRPYHTHDEVQLLTPDRAYELDIEIWPTSIVVPAGYQLALSIRGKDYDHGGEHVPLGDQLARSTKNIGYHGVEMRGCGPFLHNDPVQRPESIFGAEVTIHGGGETPSYLLLPVVRENR